jgi:hypothetical protein
VLTDDGLFWVMLAITLGSVLNGTRAMFAAYDHIWHTPDARFDDDVDRIVHEAH